MIAGRGRGTPRDVPGGWLAFQAGRGGNAPRLCPPGLRLCLGLLSHALLGLRLGRCRFSSRWAGLPLSCGTGGPAPDVRLPVPFFLNGGLPHPLFRGRRCRGTIRAGAGGRWPLTDGIRPALPHGGGVMAVLWGARPHIAGGLLPWMLLWLLP